MPASSNDVERSVLEVAAALTAEGTPIHCVRSILVPEDETCFFVFEAAAAIAVQELTRRAGWGRARVSRAIETSETDSGSG